MTPHISAQKGEIAKTVLMPGDPLRAQAIAQKYLKNVRLVSSTRNMLMFTGTYQNQEVTIAGSGMGKPSIGIYSYELFAFYDVERIIRIGTAGAYVQDLNVYDVVLTTEAFTDSTFYGRAVLGYETAVALPSPQLNEKLEAAAKRKRIELHKGRVYSADIFYHPAISLEEIIMQTQAICEEMESYALFVNAQKFNKEAACLLTIGDNLITNQGATRDEKEQTFMKMVEVALGILE